MGRELNAEESARITTRELSVREYSSRMNAREYILVPR